MHIGCARLCALFHGWDKISHPDAVVIRRVVRVVDPVDMNCPKDDGYPIVDLDSDIEGGER